MTGRAGYYVDGKWHAPHKQAQALARAEFLAKQRAYPVPVWHVSSHHGEALLFHRATGTRGK